jgi:hypothetical protein
MSAIGYIAKQMTPQAWYRRCLIRKRGGRILGKRGGVTRNIGFAAREQYFQKLRQHSEPARAPSVARTRLNNLDKVSAAVASPPPWAPFN